MIKNKYLIEHNFTNDISFLRKDVQSRNSKYRKKLIDNPTKAEVLLREWLIKNKIYHKFQKGFIVPYHRICDFYIPGIKVIIEVDGNSHDNQSWKDNSKDKTWRKKGYTTIRIKNKEIFNNSFQNKLRFLLIKR